MLLRLIVCTDQLCTTADCTARRRAACSTMRHHLEPPSSSTAPPTWKPKVLMLFCSSSFTLRAMSSLAATVKNRARRSELRATRRHADSDGADPWHRTQRPPKHRRLKLGQMRLCGLLPRADDLKLCGILSSCLTSEHVVQRHARHRGAHLRVHSILWGVHHARTGRHSSSSAWCCVLRQPACSWGKRGQADAESGLPPQLFDTI